MNRLRSIAVTWAMGHGASRAELLIIAGCWIASALTCHIALPRIAPGIMEPTVDLQLFGIVALAATAGVTSLLFHDTTAWLGATSARHLWIPRMAWAITILAASCVVGLLTSPLLPSGLPLFSAYFAVGAVWWAVALLAAAFGGKNVALLAPLALAVLATSKLVPWQWNVVVHPDLGAMRTWVACVAIVAAIFCYAILGSAHDRRTR